MFFGSKASFLALAVELAVEEEDEQVDVDPDPAEHVHDGDAVVLQVQQLLGTPDPRPSGVGGRWADRTGEMRSCNDEM